MSHYEDPAVRLDDQGLTIKSYFRPRHERHIPFASIRRVGLIEIGPLSGRYRLVGLGFRRPRNYFHWDTNRSSKTHAVEIDTGRFFRPTITPDHPQEVVDLIERSIPS